MAKRLNTSPSKVKLMHPVTKEVHEFHLEHAQRIVDYQTKRKHSNVQLWTIANNETKFIIKDGKVIVRPNNEDSN